MITEVDELKEPGDKRTISFSAFPNVEISLEGADAAKGKWFVFTASGFEAEGLAQQAGRQFKDCLNIIGAIEHLGIDVGFDQSLMVLNPEIVKRVNAEHSRRAVSDVHGLMTYQADTLWIFNQKVSAFGVTSLIHLGKTLGECLKMQTAPTERQLICASLLNDALLTESEDTKFILRVTAVEALCEQRSEGSEYQGPISHLLAALQELDCPGNVREKLSNAIGRVKQQSIRSAYKEKIEKYLGPQQSKAFEELYDLRSKLIHDGKGRGTLSVASNECLNIASALLRTEIAKMNGNSSLPLPRPENRARTISHYAMIGDDDGVRVIGMEGGS